MATKNKTQKSINIPDNLIPLIDEKLAKEGITFTAYITNLIKKDLYKAESISETQFSISPHLEEYMKATMLKSFKDYLDITYSSKSGNVDMIIEKNKEQP